METHQRFSPSYLLVEVLRYGILIVCTTIIGYPVLWMVLQSFKSTSEMYLNLWGLPNAVLLENYTRAVQMGMTRYILNSTVVAVGR